MTHRRFHFVTPTSPFSFQVTSTDGDIKGGMERDGSVPIIKSRGSHPPSALLGLASRS